MHQCVGQFAVSCKQEQACGRHVQPADSDPARTPYFWKSIENGLPPFGIGATAYFIAGLVVDEVPMSFHRRSERQSPAIQRNRLTSTHFIAQDSDPAVDAQTVRLYPGFNFAA